MGFAWHASEYFYSSEVSIVRRIVIGFLRVGKVLLDCFLVILLGTMQACHKEIDRTKAPREALQQALNLLVEERYADYFDCMDFGMDLDSTQRVLFETAILRQTVLTRELRSGLQGTRVLSAQMQSDSVATVFFRQYYANGDSIECAQKMVRNAEGRWLLRLRD